MIGRDEFRRAVSIYVETPVASAMNRVGLTPNMVTMIGLLIAGVAAYLVGVGMWWAGGLVALFAGIFDMFDGALARATGRASDFGALLDSTIDRVSGGDTFRSIGVLPGGRQRCGRAACVWSARGFHNGELYESALGGAGDRV